jgi:hypothetical protein
MADRTKTGNTVSIAVYADASQPPTKTFLDIPWFPGMTILEAMVLAQAMYVGSFEFQVEYNSRYGAFVNQIDTTPDKGTFFWLVQQNHVPAKVGVSEAIVFEDHSGQNVEIEWIYADTSGTSGNAQLTRKLQAQKARNR